MGRGRGRCTIHCIGEKWRLGGDFPFLGWRIVIGEAEKREKNGKRCVAESERKNGWSRLSWTHGFVHSSVKTSSTTKSRENDLPKESSKHYKSCLFLVNVTASMRTKNRGVASFASIILHLTLPKENTTTLLAFPLPSIFRQRSICDRESISPPFFVRRESITDTTVEETKRKKKFWGVGVKPDWKSMRLGFPENNSRENLIGIPFGHTELVKSTWEK